MAEQTRLERDSLGEITVPSAAYWGVQTQRSMNHFHATGIKTDPALIQGYVQVKRAAAVANQQVGALEQSIAQAIVTACDEMLAGNLHEHVTVDSFQAGAGTSLNMNINEVLANRALELLGHQRGQYEYLNANDHVNASQSTNDTYPTAIHLAILDRWDQLKPKITDVVQALEAKATAFHSIIKSARTHLQDAVPIRLGQEFRAYAQAISRGVRLIDAAAVELNDVALGGTAVGTGVNTPTGYGQAAIAELARLTSRPLKASASRIEATHSRQAVTAVSGSLKALAVELIRITNDLVLLSSGPGTGLAEIKIPPVLPGSSIMPAKYNPGILECLKMICIEVIGNDTMVTLANQSAQLELNTMTPVMIHAILQSLAHLANFLPEFTECINGIVANEQRCKDYSVRTAALGTVLNPTIGYLKTAELIKESLATSQSIRDLVIQKSLMTPQEIDALLSPEHTID